jgi:hypothetical protein
MKLVVSAGLLDADAPKPRRVPTWADRYVRRDGAIADIPQHEGAPRIAERIHVHVHGRVAYTVAFAVIGVAGPDVGKNKNSRTVGQGTDGTARC